MNIGEFYTRKKEALKSLKKEFPDGFLLVTSVGTASNNQKDGVVMQVTVDTASEMITHGTARQATPQESAAWKAYQQTESERIQSVEVAQIRKELKLPPADPGPQKPAGKL